MAGQIEVWLDDCEESSEDIFDLELEETDNEEEEEEDKEEDKEEEKEEDKEEDLPSFRLYKGYNYTLSGTGRCNAVERFTAWSVEYAREAYNLNLATIDCRDKDREDINTVLTADRRTPGEKSLMLIRKKTTSKISKLEQITDFSRDVFTHTLFDGSSLVPPLFSADTEGQRVMLALGENLNVYSRGGIFNTLQIRQILYQLLCFAQLCCSCQWEHLDLKPHNILLKFEANGMPRITICDFGYSKSYRYSDKADLIGGAGWMAPESLMGKIYPTSTMFSVGCLLLTLLNGEPILKEDMIPGKNKEDSGFGTECLRIYFSFFGKPDLPLFKNVPLSSRREYKLEINYPFDSNAKDKECLTRMISQMLLLDPRDRPLPFEFINDEWLRDLKGTYNYLHREHETLTARIYKLYSYIDSFVPSDEWLSFLKDSFSRDITDLKQPPNRMMQALGHLTWLSYPEEVNYTSLICLLDIDRCISPKYVYETYRANLKLCTALQQFLHTTTRLE